MSRTFFYPYLNTYLKEYFRQCVNNNDQAADSGHVAHPGDPHEEHGGHMVNERFPKILPLYVEKLRNRQRPKVREVEQIVPPDPSSHTLKSIGSTFVQYNSTKISSNVSVKIAQ